MAATLMEKAYQHLRTKFESGELLPGSQLVNRTLCKEMGVSTIPLREAIQRLTSEGLVEHIPNAGAFVRKLDRRELIQLAELRSAMELFGLDRAIVQIDEDQLHQLEGICRKWREMARSIQTQGESSLKGEDNRRWLNYDVEFHNILLDAAGNVWLKKVFGDLRLLAQITASKPAEMKLGRMALNLRVHRSLVRALRKRDLKLATYWMRQHGSHGLEMMKRNFD